MIFLSLAEAAARLWTIPMPCSPSLIRFWPPTAQRLFRVWASTPTSAFSTAPGPGAGASPSTSWKSCALFTPTGAVLLTDEGRRACLGGWQTRKQETITHPFLNEKLPWGLVPYVQALLLARTLRGDMELYPPFFWK